jgi:hypothetical protein
MEFKIGCPFETSTTLGERFNDPKYDGPPGPEERQRTEGYLDRQRQFKNRDAWEVY